MGEKKQEKPDWRNPNYDKRVKEIISRYEDEQVLDARRHDELLMAILVAGARAEIMDEETEATTALVVATAYRDLQALRAKLDEEV